MRNKAKNPAFITTIMALLTVVVIGGFLGTRNAIFKKDGKANKEVDKLIELDLDKNYPGNAREVLKVNNRILKCYYNENLTEAQLKDLAKQNQKLFDKDLLTRNSNEAYVQALKKEIEGYKKAHASIISTEIQDFSEAERVTKGGFNFCNLLVSYFLKEGKRSRRTTNKYYLREDQDGRWKILFWEAVKENDIKNMKSNKTD